MSGLSPRVNSAVISRASRRPARRFAVYALDSTEPVGRGTAGPGGSMDLTPLVDALSGDDRFTVWLRPI